MKTYCVKCRKNAESLNWKIFKTEDGRLNVCGVKKSRLVKEQEAKDLSSNLGIKTPLGKIPLLNVLF